jgi:integrase
MGQARTLTQPQDYKLRDLTRFLAERRLHDGNGDMAIKQATGAIRSFFAYAMGRKSPAAALPFPKVKRRKQRHPSADQIMQVLAVCDTTTPRGARDLALIALMYDTGLRNAEVCRLRIAEIDLDRLTLVTHVKGGGESRRYFVEETSAYLRHWMAVREKVARPECETLFCSVFHNRHAGHPLTPGGLRSIFRHMARRAGLTEKFSPHDMRRAMARAMNEGGAPESVGMQAGGWQSAGVYRGYIGDIAGAEVRRYSPMRRLMGGSK